MTILTQLRSRGGLPKASPIALELWRMAEDSTVAIHDIAALVESDPAIAARVIQLANSAAMGASHPVADLRQAVIRLGTRSVASLALATSLMTQHRTGKCTSFDYEGFWRESIIRGLTARQMAPADTNRNEAFALGLLSQIGRLAFATVFPTEYKDVLDQVVHQQCTLKLVDLERLRLQIDHNRLTAAMLEDWHLPPSFCEAVLLQDSPHKSAPAEDATATTLARSLYVGGFIAPLFIDLTPRRAHLVNLLVAAHRVDIPRDDVPTLFDAIRAGWHDITDLLPIVPHAVGTWLEIYAATTPPSDQDRAMVVTRTAQDVWGQERTDEWFNGR